MTIRRLAAGAALSTIAFFGAAGPAFAHECTNLSKDAHNPGAGVQFVFGEGDDPVYAKTGALKRIEMGVLTEDNFHGLIGLDFDGDGQADATTYIVGPNGEIPLNAQLNGSPDHGIANLCGTGCPEE
jgi:hypothetical protein